MINPSPLIASPPDEAELPAWYRRKHTCGAPLVRDRGDYRVWLHCLVCDYFELAPDNAPHWTALEVVTRSLRNGSCPTDAVAAREELAYGPVAWGMHVPCPTCSYRPPAGYRCMTCFMTGRPA